MLANGVPPARFLTVLAEIGSSRFGASTATVFPGFTPSPVGFMSL